VTEQSSEVFEMHQKGSQKLDYFLCSIAGALFAYITQTYSPQKLDNIFSILQTAALLILSVSFYAGIRRIQYANAMFRYNHDMLCANQDVVKLDALLNLPEKHSSFRNQSTGQTESRLQIEQKRLSRIEDAGAAEQLMAKARKKLARHGQSQLRLLFLGFLAILVSKILQPYESDFHRAPSPIKWPTNEVRQLESIGNSQTNK
jgi:hypothetical protein